MSHHDPCIAAPLHATLSMPPELIPTPKKKVAAASAMSAAAPAAPAAVAAAAASPAAASSMKTMLGMVSGICATAQEAAFPGNKAPVHCSVTDRAGADYQNNSALALFGMLKKEGLPEGLKSPRDVAQRLADQMKMCDPEGILAKLEVAGAGFINIYLSVDFLSRRVHSFVTVGVLPPPCERKRVVVDFSSPNVAKEMHVGHLRSTIIGDALCRVLEYCGHDVSRVNHVGDWGTQFGMLIAHMKRVYPDFATKAPPIADLQQFYRDAKKFFDEDEAFKHDAHQEVVRLQSGDGVARHAWQQICEVSRREFEKVYSRLDVKLTEVGESFYNEYIPPLMAHLEEIGLVQLNDGANLIFPPNVKLEQPLIVVKSDGGFGYDSTDMAGVWYRLKELQADWVLYVTDAGQGPHFELVFAAAEAAGFTKPSTKLDHVPFGMVCGDDGKKFKTRSGDVVRLVDLLDEAVERMLTGMRVRAADGGGRPAPTSAPMDEAEVQSAARVLGYGAVKYADLKSNRISNYIFSYDRMLDAKGNTAVYLLYAGARISSILRKAGVSEAELLARGATVDLKEEAELDLGRALLRFQEAVDLTLTTLLPSSLCDYLYTLCGDFTTFYSKCRVVGSAEQDSRLLLLYALEKVLRTGYSLLGIGYLERI
jgi:arginyl-tRNA synthetase